MAGYGTPTRRVGGVTGGFPTDPHEAALLNIRFVSDLVVDLSDYNSLKLIKTVGGLDSFEFNAGKIEWIEDDLYRRADTITTTLATTVTALPVVGKAHRYPKGTVLELVSTGFARELMLVTAQASADALTVVRGFGPSSDPGTTYASGTAFRVAGFAHAESQTWTPILTSLKAVKYNYPSIFAFSVQSTFRNEGINRYGQSGVGADFDEQVAKSLKRAVLTIEQALLLGQRNVGTGTADPSMMGGLLEYVDASYDANVVEINKAGAALTLANINDNLQAVAQIVGAENVPTSIICDYWGLRKINSFFEPNVKLERSENTVGLMVQRMDTVVGQVEFLADANMPPGIMLFINPSMVRMGHMAGLGKLHVGENPARTGDFFEKYVYGDYSAEIKNPVTMCKIVDYSTTS